MSRAVGGDYTHDAVYQYRFLFTAFTMLPNHEPPKLPVFCPVFWREIALSLMGESPASSSR